MNSKHKRKPRKTHPRQLLLLLRMEELLVLKKRVLRMLVLKIVLRRSKCLTLPSLTPWPSAQRVGTAFVKRSK
jgi:hypothetical protein